VIQYFPSVIHVASKLVGAPATSLGGQFESCLGWLRRCVTRVAEQFQICLLCLRLSCSLTAVLLSAVPRC
jgi:hypothetical protein